MKPTKDRQEIEIPSIFTADGRTPNACVLLPEACFSIPAGSYLLIDTDTPYIDGDLSVVLLDGELKLLRVNIVDDELTLFTADSFPMLMDNDERIERVQYVGVVLQALISVSKACPFLLPEKNEERAQAVR